MNNDNNIDNLISISNAKSSECIAIRTERQIASKCTSNEHNVITRQDIISTR